MLRRVPLQRVGFKAKPKKHQPNIERADRPMAQLSPSTRKATYAGSTSGKPVEKDAPARSEEYRRLVAQMPCFLCGIPGHSQAAHADEGKGLSLKADDRTCYPLCATRPGIVGCHDLVGASGLFTREKRRELEHRAGRETRAFIWIHGKWPKGLPRYEE